MLLTWPPSQPVAGQEKCMEGCDKAFLQQQSFELKELAKPRGTKCNNHSRLQKSIRQEN